jgi:hypothetical protein
VVALIQTPRMPGYVLPINIATRTAGRVIGVGNEPLSIAFTP